MELVLEMNMAVAVIETGGKQYLVHEGEEFHVEKMPTETDGMVDFTDLLHGKKVTAKIVRHDRAQKINIVKFRSKVRYLRRQGHRQPESIIRIESIQ